jgi:hypothetical protein
MDQNRITIRLLGGCAAVVAAVLSLGLQLALASHYANEADAIMAAKRAAVPMAQKATATRQPG